MTGGEAAAATSTENKKDGKDTRRRVKLYVLNDKRSWDDRGTGHVICAYNETLQSLALTVRSEVDGNVIMESRIVPEIVYQKQQETLIVWSEGDSCDLALSFQEKNGCDEIWEKICQIQGKDPLTDAAQEATYEGESDGGSPDATPSTIGGGSISLHIQLPTCELSRLAEIRDLVQNCFASALRRDNLATAIENEGYIKKLLEIFRISEDLENVESLHLLFQIFKNIFMLNKNALFEILFAEENLKDVVGVLEYDPLAPPSSSSGQCRHRDYLWEQAKFKEVIPIASAELKAKIHQTYRVQYIQDIILPRPSIFEENLLSTLSSFIFFNKVEIVSLIQDDDQFLAELFNQLTSKTSTADRKRDLALFLKEFCGFSQTLQPQSREAFFRTVTSHGILLAIESCIASEDDQTRLAVIEIFSHVVDFNASLVRDYALQQRQRQMDDDGKLFFNIVIEQLFQDKDPELSATMQLANILKILIDPESMMSSAQSKTEKNEFLQFFYKRCMAKLCAPLVENTEKDKPQKDDYHTAHLCSILLDLLTFCIEHHSYHARSCIISKDLLKRVLVLLKSRHSFLSLGALRLFRRITNLKDEFYNRHIVKQKLFDPIVQCFFANGNKYNLLNSAMLELFEFVRQEEQKTLCNDLVERYIDQFKDIDYIKTFEGLKLRYEQTQERLRSNSDRSSPTPPPVWRKEKDPREMDEDEEHWFNEEEEEWEDEQPGSITSLAGVSGGLKAGNIPQSMMPRANSMPRETPSTSHLNYVTPPRPKSTSAIQWEEENNRNAGKLKESIFGELNTNGSAKPALVRAHKITIKPPSPASIGSPSGGDRSCSPAPSSSSSDDRGSPTSSVSLRKSLVDYDYGDSDDDDESEASSSDSITPTSTSMVNTTTAAAADTSSENVVESTGSPPAPLAEGAHEHQQPQQSQQPQEEDHDDQNDVHNEDDVGDQEGDDDHIVEPSPKRARFEQVASTSD